MAEKQLNNTLNFDCININIDNNVKIESNEVLLSFGIDYNSNTCETNTNCVENKSFPKLILPQIDSKELSNDFTDEMEKTIYKMIGNNDEYYNKVWIHFLKCLKKYEIIDREKPCFVSFDSNIEYILTKPFDKWEEMNTNSDYNKWQKNNVCHRKLDIVMFKGIYYLRRSFETNFEIPEHSFTEFNDIKSKIYRNSLEKRFSDMKLCSLVTNIDCNHLNEFEKYFLITKLKLNSHNILTLNKIDAIDENGKQVMIKSCSINRNEMNFEKFWEIKHLEYWSHCRVTGIERIIFGNHEFKSNVFKDIDEYSVEELSQRCIAYWSEHKCYQFLDSFLQFVKQSVTQELSLYEFDFNRKERKIFCNKITSGVEIESVLPQFYTNSQ